jgi:hypothetical protein
MLAARPGAPHPPRLVGIGAGGCCAASPGNAGPRPRWLWTLLLIPGGLILAVGLGIAWAGLVLLLPGLRRLSTASAGTSVAPGLTCHRDSKPAPQSYGEPHEPSQRWEAN